MTEAAATTRQPDPADFLQLWSDSLSQVLGQISGAAVGCKLAAETPADFPAAAEGDLWALVTSSGGLRGEMSLRIPAPTVLRLAQIFMSEPATPEAQPTADHRDAVIELLSQVAGIVATGAKARWGEIQLRAEAAAAGPSWASAGSYWVQAGEEGAAGMTLEFSLSAALVAELRIDKAEAAKNAGGAEAAKAESGKAAGPSSAAAAGEAASAGTLDLLMDVELAMTLRFGSKTLLLKEVLDLNPGSVVELNRKIQEPVDLLLDGRVVARGEVVVIEGNYGLRVTEIAAI
jgi:flagellar motor switch protein FliN